MGRPSSPGQRLCLKHFWANWEGPARPHGEARSCASSSQADLLQPGPAPGPMPAGLPRLAPQAAATQEASWGGCGCVTAAIHPERLNPLKGHGDRDSSGRGGSQARPPHRRRLWPQGQALPSPPRPLGPVPPSPRREPGALREGCFQEMNISWDSEPRVTRGSKGCFVVCRLLCFRRGRQAAGADDLGGWKRAGGACSPRLCLGGGGSIRARRGPQDLQGDPLPHICSSRLTAGAPQTSGGEGRRGGVGDPPTVALNGAGGL